MDYSGRAAISATMLLITMMLMCWSPVMASVDCLAMGFKLVGCKEYLKNGWPEPSKYSPCCNGVRTIYSEAATPRQRRRLCQCVEEAAMDFDLNDDAFRHLPSACGLRLPFIIDKKTDCSTIP